MLTILAIALLLDTPKPNLAIALTPNSSTHWLVQSSTIMSQRISITSATRVSMAETVPLGLRVVKAMVAGLPCTVSNLPALKENFHSAAVFVNPIDVESIAQEISITF